MRRPCADREEKRVTRGSDTIRKKIEQEQLDLKDPNLRVLTELLRSSPADGWAPLRPNTYSRNDCVTGLPTQALEPKMPRLGCSRQGIPPSATYRSANARLVFTQLAALYQAIDFHFGVFL